jgi:superfamily II DNA or RNA helicase
MRLPSLPPWPRGEADVLVARHLLTSEQEHAIKSVLRLENPNWHKALNNGQPVDGIPRWLRVYEQYDRFYRLPRHAPFQRMGIATPQIVFPETKKLPWEFTGQLRPNQDAPFAALRSQLIRRRDGILVLSCGKGKTVLAAAGFGWLQRPAVAVVTQLFIAKQWKKELLQHTNIPEDRIGFIGDGYAEWDKDFVIATIQTLSQKDFPPEFYRRFGIFYADEVHRLGSKFFSRVAPMFTGIRIGLTATLERSDGMEKLFQFHLGRPFYEDKSQDLIPRVYFVRTPTEKDVTGFKQWGTGKLNMAKIVTHLSRLDYRQDFIVGQIADAVERGRKVLVLSERREELTVLQERLAARNIRAGICVGGMSQELREQALEERVILATAQLVKEGLDKKDIDTLILLYPMSSESFAEQAAGRILRLDDAKRPPVIVVLVDYGCYARVGYDAVRRPFTMKAKRMESTFTKLNYAIARKVEHDKES